MSAEADELRKALHKVECADGGHLPQWPARVLREADETIIGIACWCGDTTWTRNGAPLPKFSPGIITVRKGKVVCKDVGSGKETVSYYDHRRGTLTIEDLYFMVEETE